MKKKETRFSPLPLLVGAILALFGVASALCARTTRHAPNPAVSLPHFTPDKGNFRILMKGQEVGKEEFEMSPGSGGWIIRVNSAIQTPQGVTHVSGTLHLREDGTPTHYEWSTQGQKKASAAVDFNGSVAIIELQMEGARPYTQQLTFNSPHVVVLDSNLDVQYEVLARLYDWDKKGAQSFSVLVPQENTPGTITAESVGKKDFNGKSLDELVVKTEDIELNLYLDGLRLVRIVNPSTSAEVVRE